ncbi:MAG: thiamine biosynthesis lipoprotein [Candidatus Paceibacteria bacterium]|jgi:thiamine biosynthesis lipoprotein
MNWTPVILSLSLCVGCTSPALVRHEEFHDAMGTRFHLVLYATSADEARLAALASWARLGELEAIMSDYDRESEVSQLSRSGGEWVACSPDLWRVLKRSKELNEATAGAFDITVGPLVQVWRRAMRQQEFPSEQDIARAKQAVGTQRIEFDPGEKRVRLPEGFARLDLGGIAKGDALDQIMNLLHARNMDRALVEGGGDVLVGAAPPDAPGWVIDLQGASGSLGRITLKQAALATSGSTFHYLEHEGVRYSHIVDPASGIGVVDPFQVSVLATDAATADAVATALSVMGVESGESWIESTDGLEACWTRAENQGLQSCTSEHFPLRLKTQEARPTARFSSVPTANSPPAKP